MTDTVADLLADWVPRQRWFREGSGTPAPLACFFVPGSPQIEVYLLGGNGPTYHVPVTVRARPLAGTEPIGMAPPSGRAGSRYVYDAPHDPAYIRLLLDRMGVPRSPRPRLRVLSGEQSNTSVVVKANGVPLIVKVFRVLAPGANPDIEVPARLAAAGVRCVARPAGAAHIDWGAGPADMASAVEYLPDSQDGWQWLLWKAASAADTRSALRDLGRTTAELHAGLREVFATESAHPGSLRADLAARVEWAIGAAGDHLGDLADRLRTAVAEADLTGLPTRQRIHGDYHLGQVLRSPSRGWVVVDFEGEPLRPLVERTRADYPERDVAGMLRSFDYAAATVQREGKLNAEAAGRWAADCADAYLSGYDGDLHQGLVRAFWLDKAVYEVVYEAQNRPTWVDIPLAALRKRLDG